MKRTTGCDASGDDELVPAGSGALVHSQSRLALVRRALDLIEQRQRPETEREMIAESVLPLLDFAFRELSFGNGYFSYDSDGNAQFESLVRRVATQHPADPPQAWNDNTLGHLHALGGLIRDYMRLRPGEHWSDYFERQNLTEADERTLESFLEEVSAILRTRGE